MRRKWRKKEKMKMKSHSKGDMKSFRMLMMLPGGDAGRRIRRRNSKKMRRNRKGVRERVVV